MAGDEKEQIFVSVEKTTYTGSTQAVFEENCLLKSNA